MHVSHCIVLRNNLKVTTSLFCAAFSMLAPRASSAFVCLRCELQLARRPLPALARRNSLAHFSASAQHHDGAAELEALSRAQHSSLKITKEVQPLNRIRRQKGKFIKETSAKLSGRKSLGDDAEILVVEEVGRKEAPREPASKPKQSEPVEVPDIHASLQVERAAVTSQEVLAQIESLRPQIHVNPDDPQYVTQTTFVKLIKTLMNGFTQQQLAVFYAQSKNAQLYKSPKDAQDGIALKDGRSTTGLSIQRSPWQPGITSIYSRPSLGGKSKRQPVDKRRIVDRILRESWKLVLLEEIEAPGELELSLRPWQLALLSVGESDTILDKVGTSRRAKLEVFEDHNVLRITADKTTAEYAATDIEESLQNTEVKRLNLKPWVPLLVKEKVPEGARLHSLFTKSDYDTVSTLTRTSIVPAGEAMVCLQDLGSSQ